MDIRRSLLPFFILTFAISWGLGGICIFLFGSPAYVVGRSTSNPLFFLFFGFGPSFAAFTMTAVTGGGQTRELFGRMILWKLDPRWYLIVLLGIPALGLCASGLSVLSGGSFSEYWGLANLKSADSWHGEALFLLAALGGEIIGGPLSEEPGWRGFALPRLLQSLTPLPAAVVLGIVWAVWHLPLFLMAGVGQSHIWFPLFVVQVVALSILITWIFIHTRHSVLLAILAHLFFNLSFNVFHVFAATLVSWLAAIMVISMGGLAVPSD